MYQAYSNVWKPPDSGARFRSIFSHADAYYRRNGLDFRNAGVQGTSCYSFRQFGSDVVPQAYVHDELVKSLQTWTNGSVPRELNQWYSQQRDGPVIPFGSKHLVQEYTFFLYALGDRSSGGTRILRPFVGYVSVGDFLSGSMCGYFSHPRLGFLRCSVSLTRMRVSLPQPLCLLEDSRRESSSTWTTKARRWELRVQ